MKMKAENRPGRTYFPPGEGKHGGTAVSPRWQIGWPNPPSRPLTTSSKITSPTPPFREQQHHEENRGDRQLHSLQRKIEVALPLHDRITGRRISNSNSACGSHAGVCLEDINDTRRSSYAGNQSYTLDPKMTSTIQESSPQRMNKKSALAGKKGKEKGRASDGSIPGNNNNSRSSNAARAVRVAEVNRGVVTPETHPKSLNEVPPIYRANGGTPSARTLLHPLFP